MQTPSADEESRYHCRLPFGLRRAAPEIYAGLRSQGSVSVRDWLVNSRGAVRKDHRYVDLWTIACMIDYEVSKTANAESMFQMRMVSSEPQVTKLPGGRTTFLPSLRLAG